MSEQLQMSATHSELAEPTFINRSAARAPIHRAAGGGTDGTTQKSSGTPVAADAERNSHAGSGPSMIADPLLYFAAAAKHEHLGHAAEELRMSQPALSRSVARLEGELGVRLFDRAGRGIRLNAAGRILLRRVNRAFAELEDARRELREGAEKSRRLVSIGFLATFGARVIPDLIRRFKASNPRIQFRLLQGAYPSLRERLAGGEIDLCLSSPRFADANLDWKPLYSEELRLLVPAAHRLATRPSVDLIEIANEPIVALRKDYGLRLALEELSRQAGFTPEIAYEGEEVTTLRGLVGAGFGVALVPSSSVDHSPDVVSLAIRTPECRRVIGLSWRQGRYLSLTTRLFRDYIINSFPTATGSP
jgi:DNA-binding transcriptional LysR family regulator